MGEKPHKLTFQNSKGIEKLNLRNPKSLNQSNRKLMLPAPKVSPYNSIPDALTPNNMNKSFTISRTP